MTLVGGVSCLERVVGSCAVRDTRGPWQLLGVEAGPRQTEYSLMGSDHCRRLQQLWSDLEQRSTKGTGRLSAVEWAYWLIVRLTQHRGRGRS